MRAFFLENKKHVNGWYWSAGLDGRGCAACWAMHGTFHPLTEPMQYPPGCRCTSIPAVKSWSERGYPGQPERAWKPKATGEDLFRELPDATVRRILGPRRFKEYQAGTITKADVRREVLGPKRAALYEQGKASLSDMVQVRRSPQ